MSRWLLCNDAARGCSLRSLRTTKTLFNGNLVRRRRVQENLEGLP